jgi:hypothetical protein
MRTDEQLIRAALADSEFELPKEITPQIEGPLRIYDIELPSFYKRGLPPHWRFTIVEPTRKTRSQAQRNEFVEVAQRVISTHPRVDDAVPMIFLTEDPAVRLRDELPTTHPKIFFLDQAELSSHQINRPIKPRFAPLILAMRRALGREASALLLSPYLPGKPARNWRFHGRRRELDQLVHSPDNFIVVGGRRIGKTSLLWQAEIELRKEGLEPYFVDLQDCQNDQELANRILQKLSPRDYASLMRRHDYIHDRMLHSALSRLSGSGKVVLLLDELGNVLDRRKDEAWKVLGVLRQYAHSGRIKIVATSFQEFFLKQQEDYSGPWVNFANIVRLTGFEKDEIQNLVVDPLAFWADIQNPSALVELVCEKVGRHPLLLQHFCQSMFLRLIQSKTPTPDLLDIGKSLIASEIISSFSEAATELFYRVRSPLLRYLFLAACVGEARKERPIAHVQIDDDSVEKALLNIKIESTTLSRLNLLEGLETRGLTQPVGGYHGRQEVIVPLIYYYIERAERDLHGLLQKYAREARREAPEWGVRTLVA